MKFFSQFSFPKALRSGGCIAAIAGAILLGLAPDALSAPAKRTPKAGHGSPSAQIDPLLSPCLEAIAAPLNQSPNLPRVEVEKLRSTFAADQVTAETPHQRQIFQQAMAVCDALTHGMDERAKDIAAAQAGGTMPTMSTGGGIIKSSPIRGRNAGANAEAIRKKQGNERSYADKEARSTATFVESGAYKAWTDKATRLRQGVMTLFTQLKQFEAYEEKEVKEARQAAATPPPAEEKPAAATNANATPSAPQQPEVAGKKSLSCAGTWVGDRKNAAKVVLGEDHSASRTAENGKRVTGKWSLDQSGNFEVQWEGQKGAKAKLSDDGKTLDFRFTQWTRQ